MPLAQCALLAVIYAQVWGKILEIQEDVVRMYLWLLVGTVGSPAIVLFYR